MNVKLTYILSLFFLACYTSSCTSDVPDNVEVSKGSEMSFAVADMSRASAATSFNRFAVYGDMKLWTDDAAAPKSLFSKTEVVYIDGSWCYEGTQYWYPKHEHSFVAIAPVSALETSDTPRYSNSLLSFTYKIPTAVDGKVSDYGDVDDIIVATHRRYFDEDDTDATATFHFGHIMSQINISPAFDDNIMEKEEYISFKEMELSGFKTKATVSLLPASRQSNLRTDDRVIEFSGLDEDGDVTIEFAEPVRIANDRNNVRLFDDKAAIIMLPQSFAEDSDARIVLYYTINNDPLIKQITLPLKGIQWESGKSYNYTFTFDRRGLISGSTSISDWNVLNVGNIDAR